MIRHPTLFVAALLAAAATALSFPQSTASDSGPARADVRVLPVQAHR
jgi:hypothetical protein